MKSWWKIAALATIGWLAFEGFSDMTKQAAEAPKGPGATTARVAPTMHPSGWLFAAYLNGKRVHTKTGLGSRDAALAYGNSWLAQHNASGLQIEVSGVTVDLQGE